MFIVHKNTKIYYEIQNKTEANSILFLNGWGYDMSVIKPLANQFKNYKKIFIDFAPFGKSGKLACVWNLKDYTECVLKILAVEKIDKAKIISHSFGGRVAIMLSSHYNMVESLVLIASAGIKPKKSLKTRILIARYKHRKRKNKDVSKLGSEDYLALNEIERKTFVNIVNCYQNNSCKKIKCETLIIAGKYDKSTPLYMQKKLNKLILPSSLLVLKAKHFVWVDAFFETVNAINNFFNKEN